MKFYPHPHLVPLVALLVLFSVPSRAQDPSRPLHGAIPDSTTLNASGPGPLASDCTPTKVTLKGRRSGADAVFTWVPENALFTISHYVIFRQDSPENLTGTPPFATTLPSVKTFSDPEVPAPILFYRIMPATTFFTLEWPGPYMDPLEPEQNNDGFKPDPLFPYVGAPEDTALSGDPAEFWVDVRSMLGCIPSTVELLVDRNDDDDFDDAGEVVPMAPLVPGEPTAADSLYFVRLEGIEPPGTVPTAASPLYARDDAGLVRWAKADGSGALRYQFRAWDATAYAGGPAAAGATLTLQNTAAELIEDLGKPEVAAGNCGYDTDWATALKYFEEAETLLKPPSPFNQAADPAQHPDYLSALMASTIAETAYTIRNYDTLFQGDPGKPYRDVMLDWIAFADEQTARLDAIAAHAPSAPDPAWKLDFPRFCIFTEGGAAPFAATQALAPFSTGPLQGLDRTLPLGPVPAPSRLAKPQSSRGLRAPEPVYIFGDNADAMAEWDRADAYLLKAYARALHAAAVGYRIYEDPTVSPVLVSDLDWIDTALTPEDDAEAHAECDPKPCPPLDGLDDDGDGLVDDLGFAARVVEMFPGLGIYTPDGSLTLEAAADDSSAMIDALREGMRLVLKEEDNQTGTGVAVDRADATLVYEHNYGIPTSFEDNWSYVDGEGVPDGLPDLAYAAGDDLLPIAWCPEDGIQHAPPLDIQGGLGDDIEWWIDQAVDFYNKYSGEPPLDPACYPQAWGYTVMVADWGWQWQKALLPASDPRHLCFDFRDDIERLLTEYDVDPADLGPDAETILSFLECIDVRRFIDAPEDVRDYLAFSCDPPAVHDAPACPAAGTYTFNGFYGDWDEPLDPIVPGKFWTIEPFSTFKQDANGLLDQTPDPACTPAVPYDPDRDCICQPSRLSTDADCIRPNWNDINGNGEYDLFEPIQMADAHTPALWIDLNNDGQWNGWTDRSHLKVAPAYYQGMGLAERADPGAGLYNGLYIYFKDPSFGGRLPGMTNEDLNNFVGAAAGWADGPLEFPSGNHHPVIHDWAVDACGGGANYCFHIVGSDPDPADAVHYKLVAPAGVAIVKDGLNDGIFRLNVPPGTWGLIGLAYDNVNNLNDIAGRYVEVTRP